MTSDKLTAEEVEWAHEMANRWTDVYKKSATTLFVLQIVRDNGPLPASNISEYLSDRTGWEVTDRAMYRTLQRLAKHDIVSTQQVAVPRTGAPRNDFTLTELGSAYLTNIEAVAER